MRQYVPSHSMIDVTANGHQHAADVYVRVEDIPRWIPVGERLPEVGQRVLAYEKPELVVVVEIHRYATGGCWWSADAGHTAYSVFPSHWMPLPAPPAS